MQRQRYIHGYGGAEGSLGYYIGAKIFIVILSGSSRNMLRAVKHT
jgi:hypothetical protein